ncbi:TetR/AcrR family transcriptional regulator [Reinekea blandensis]|uniref:Transcriptional regulator n=1 Tax=Reinekea blandensis MED297 TaxID=314283 RepID=A4B9H7_9GAMM|nr:TetR/AcrR family transcriptional regulator [Reinekea blandensis]EAR11278.1 Transcriptional regulator [Reinekea sp. MED297] [Reinekea blandensis MED297]
MAQPSKKNLIAHAALPLFLENGLKGSSIDMVVKASGVSKPTVYNHFPDKSYLVSYVVELWLSTQPAPAFRAKTLNGLTREFSRQWMNPEAVRLYGLLLGERGRAEAALATFLQQYDAIWRQCLSDRAEQQGLDAVALNHAASHTLFTLLSA